MKKEHVFIIALLIAVFAIGYHLYSKNRGSESSGQFPSLEKVAWMGEKPEIKPGSIYLAEFWATWCPPCRQSIPHLNEIHQKYSSKGLLVLGISDEPQNTIEEFRKTVEMSYHVGTETSGQLMKTLGVRGIPAAFFVKDNTILWRGHPMQINEALIEKMMK